MDSILSALKDLLTNVKNLSLPGLVAAFGFALLLWPPQVIDIVNDVEVNQDYANDKWPKTQIGLESYAGRIDPVCNTVPKARERALPNPTLIESILVLAFLPMLHGTIRRVGKQQPGLAEEDITQQALSFLLQYLRSDELQARNSHFAFAISRAVKRQVFEWANGESGRTGLFRYCDSEAFEALAAQEPFERYAFLRHFLHRCVTKGLLADAELDLLVQFKLNGTSREEFADFNGTSSNALRQRLKRLVAKLRRLAR